MKLKNHMVEKRPWGKFEQFTLNEPTTVKLITVKAKKRLSYQKHKLRSELWVCVKNSVGVVINGRRRTLNEGQMAFVSKGSKHRLVGLSKDGQILEVSFGKFKENDIKRFEDDFGRAGKPGKK